MSSLFGIPSSFQFVLKLRNRPSRKTSTVRWQPSLSRLTYTLTLISDRVHLSFPLHSPPCWYLSTLILTLSTFQFDCTRTKNLKPSFPFRTSLDTNSSRRDRNAAYHVLLFLTKTLLVLNNSVGVGLRSYPTSSRTSTLPMSVHYVDIVFGV